MLRVAQPQPDELRTDGAHFRTVEVRVGEIETAGVELVGKAMDSLGTGAVVVTRRRVDAELFNATESGIRPRARQADQIGSRRGAACARTAATGPRGPSGRRTRRR